ncbi:hypothetical protein [Plantactinospora sp. CA-290183]|uniref:hypothetical protein n=1 Tax=Plantactinospora sp. CA-290183 TaxID=3240006 RepID=UPI003D8A317A
MGTVTVMLRGGPADGAVRELSAGPDGGPPAVWVLEQRNSVPGMTPDQDHRYEAEPEPAADGTWTMTYVRSTPGRRRQR